MATTSDLLAKLEADKIDCPVCHKLLKPSVAPVKVMAFPIGDSADRVALLPVHKACLPEAQEKIRKGIDDVKRRQATGLWLPGPVAGELRNLD